MAPGFPAVFHRDFPSAGRRILVPCHKARCGHPVIIPARSFPEILTRHDAVGLRGVMQAHPDAIVELEMNDPALLTDMDRAESCNDHSFTFLSRSAFAITDTELKLIAAAAIIGLSSRPKNG